ncbi:MULTISPECIES: hypothetical protein [Streptomyces]|uniref:Uncharacterized protein n=1 Tax=Streptomyces gilvifuscus TaxID=1550617 RepID=A0ABT5FSM7_9ACTN|nr:MULTISPECIES: hypothetical protein [Streptomyces]MBK3643369.1 hypothetical protein [Streptomyces sp. MBT33]MDC2955504.1 hypothetical protein [Streptomyces gilvifuscus]
MGYWGYYVVGRGERPLAECDALAGVKEGMELRAEAAGGWQVWEFPSGDGEVGNMNVLAAQTGAPALFGYVMNSDCVVVEAAAPESGAWTTCLARSAMARHLGVAEGLTLEDYFLDARDAAERAVAWAAEAGCDADAEALAEVLTADPGPPSLSTPPERGDSLAENLFFRLLDRLGVVPL